MFHALDTTGRPETEPGQDCIEGLAASLDEMSLGTLDIAVAGDLGRRIQEFA